MTTEPTTTTGPLQRIDLAHRRIATRIEQIFAGWFVGLSARLVFLAVLLPYYLNSAATKVGP